MDQSGTASVLLRLCLSSPLPLPSPTSPHAPSSPPPVAPFASPPESNSTEQIYRKWTDASGGQTRRPRPPSGSPIILYGSSSGRAFITLNYAPQLLPLPPPGPCSGRPWPYRPIILPRRSLTQKRLIYSATSASNMTPLWIFELYVLTSIVRDACGAVAGPVCAEPKRAAGAYCLDGAPLCGCARYTPPLHLIKPHDRNLEFPFFSPAAQAASVSAPKLFLSAFGVLPPPLR